MDDSFFNMFTDLGDFMFLDAKNQYELPEWDRPQPTFTLVRAHESSRNKPHAQHTRACER